MAWTPFLIRRNKPIASEDQNRLKCYIRTDNGGWNPCILGSPTDPVCNVLANCVGQVYGRFSEIYNEIMGTTGNHCFSTSVQPKNFYPNAESHGFTIGQVPRPGAVMCFDASSESTTGHIQIVEDVNEDGSVKVSWSAYNGITWGFDDHLEEIDPNDPNKRWGHLGFQGFVYNPAVVTYYPNEIKIGADGNLKYMLGDMGVQRIYVGDALYYKRQSSFCYIQLEATQSYQQFIPYGASECMKTSDGKQFLCIGS